MPKANPYRTRADYLPSSVPSPTIRAHVTTVDLRPGTHRLKFIVDEQWKCANDLPTAVDDGGNLVNYIEVAEESMSDAVLGWERGLTSAPGTSSYHA